ncbi:MAG TPA: M48 family peptidase, partial [Methylobacter sp.]
MSKKLFSALIITCLLAACVTSPTGRSQLMFLSDSQVDQMGLQAFDNLKKEKPISTNSQYNQLASCIAGAITQQAGGG